MKQTVQTFPPVPTFHRTVLSSVKDCDSAYSAYIDRDDPHLYRSRGEILVSVLEGTCSTQTQAIRTDSDSNPDSPIDYHPDGDSRLDRFDGLELGYGLMDNALDERRTSKENSTEEKE